MGRTRHVARGAGLLLATPAALWVQGADVAPSADWLLRISLALAVVGLLIAAAVVFRARRGNTRFSGGSAEPFLLFQPHPERAPQEPAPLEEFAATPAPRAAAVADPVRSGTPGSPQLVDGQEIVEGRTIRFFQPASGTLQLLPGRLEVVQGEDLGHVIRFVRASGGTPEITFGRRDGPPYRHIQLKSATVSREHALMRLQAEQWTITNLSHTNPVIVNGEELEAVGGSLPLGEGDRIEMGEIVFQFRSS